MCGRLRYRIDPELLELVSPGAPGPLLPGVELQVAPQLDRLGATILRVRAGGRALLRHPEAGGDGSDGEGEGGGEEGEEGGLGEEHGAGCGPYLALQTA